MDSGADSSPAPESSAGDQETFFLPQTDAAWAKGLNKGDEITFRVVGVDEKGNVELTYATDEGGESEGGDFMDGFDKHMGGQEAPANPGNY